MYDMPVFQYKTSNRRLPFFSKSRMMVLNDTKIYDYELNTFNSSFLILKETYTIANLQAVSYSASKCTLLFDNDVIKELYTTEGRQCCHALLARLTHITKSTTTTNSTIATVDSLPSSIDSIKDAVISSCRAVEYLESHNEHDAVANVLTKLERFLKDPTIQAILDEHSFCKRRQQLKTELGDFLQSLTEIENEHQILTATDANQTNHTIELREFALIEEEEVEVNFIHELESLTAQFHELTIDRARA